MGNLTKKELEHLAELARLDLKPGEEEKLQNDLGAILDHFKELEGLDTSKVSPMTGGTMLKNALREDELSEKFPPKADPPTAEKVQIQKSIRAFPDNQDGYLRVPPVF